MQFKTMNQVQVGDVYRLQEHDSKGHEIIMEPRRGVLFVKTYYLGEGENLYPEYRVVYRSGQPVIMVVEEPLVKATDPEFERLLEEEEVRETRKRTHSSFETLYKHVDSDGDEIEFLIYVMAMIVVAGMFMLGLLYATANVSGPDDEPYCPTEDSCEPQWHNGEWHIVEVTP